MKFINVNMNYFQEALDIAVETYKNECQYVKEICGVRKDDISKELEEIFLKQNGILCFEDEKLVGYLVYQNKWYSDGIINYLFPFWGYGAVGTNRVKIMSMLFEVLAEQLCTEQKVYFTFKVYAHDQEIIQLLSFLQFGIQCEEGICNINMDVMGNELTNIRELSKNEIRKCWDDIWKLLLKLIGHLRKSPVFYPGTEFTQDVYKDYIFNKNTRLFIAEIEGEIVGIITANRDGNNFINTQTGCYNVGDVYVVPEYRGRMVAQSMLKFLCNVLSKEGVQNLWVEHGTANPNARGFWNKFFESYSYTMIRNIELL